MLLPCLHPHTFGSKGNGWTVAPGHVRLHLQTGREAWAEPATLDWTVVRVVSEFTGSSQSQAQRVDLLSTNAEGLPARFGSF